MGDDYMPRHLDEVIRDNLRLFGAVVVTGPKWCGKTTTASRLAKGVISLQDERQYTRYRALADMDPQLVLSGERPLLIDEWQSIPELWDAVRYNVDLSKKKGQFILTGSVSFRMDDDRIRHSGSGRISRIRMRTMTLSESGNSTSEVSLGALFDGCPKVMGLSRLELDDIAGEIVRGGWPETVGLDDMDAHKVVRSYCETLLEGKVDTSDGKVRDIRHQEDEGPDEVPVQEHGVPGPGIDAGRGRQRVRKRQDIHQHRVRVPIPPGRPVRHGRPAVMVAEAALQDHREDLRHQVPGRPSHRRVLPGCREGRRPARPGDFRAPVRDHGPARPQGVRPAPGGGGVPLPRRGRTGGGCGHPSVGRQVGRRGDQAHRRMGGQGRGEPHQAEGKGGFRRDGRAVVPDGGHGLRGRVHEAGRDTRGAPRLPGEPNPK